MKEKCASSRTINPGNGQFVSGLYIHATIGVEIVILREA